MERLYDMLCDELEKLTEQGELTPGSLDVAEKITETMKNLVKIMDYEDYSGNYGTGGSYGRMSYEGRSYARGDNGRGNVRRDSRGRYSRDGYSRDGYSRHDMVDKLEELMHSAPDEKSRKEIERLMTKMERM